MAYVYVITNNINNKQYVGKTNFSLQKRFQEHIRDSKQQNKEHRPLYNAFNKYGIENFSIDVLEECSWKDAANREIYWIGKLDTYENGYNATLGGDSRTLYNYEIIAKSYLELPTLQDVCNEFGCSAEVVRAACKEYNIFIDKNRLKRKPVAMLDKKTEEILKTFSSTYEAARFLGNENKNTHIGQVCNNKRKTAYGYKWKYI